MIRLIPLAALLMLSLALPLRVSAQDATPVVGRNGCTVEPMSQERIDQLAMLAATPTPLVEPAPVDLSQGQPVSQEVRAELQWTIHQLQACSAVQDLPRLLSLHTERFIVEQFFAQESVQIVPTIDGTPIGSNIPEGATDQEMMVMNAVLLTDGRIAANVSGNAWGGDQRLYLFAQHGDRWLIDQIWSTAGDIPVGGGAAVAIPADAQGAVDLVLKDAATKLGVEVAALSVSAIEATDWPDSSLGCPEDGGVYAQVISPGYRITVTDGASSLVYHTGPNDVVVICGG